MQSSFYSFANFMIDDQVIIKHFIGVQPSISLKVIVIIIMPNIFIEW